MIRVLIPFNLLDVHLPFFAAPVQRYEGTKSYPFPDYQQMIPITHPFTCQHITSSTLISRKDITVLINPCFGKCKIVMESLNYRLPFLLTWSYGPCMDQRPKHTTLYLDQGILLFTSRTAMRPYLNSSCNHAKFKEKKKPTKLPDLGFCLSHMF